MPVEGKYGRVTLERGDIGEDEPVFVFRGRDRLLPRVLEGYIELCSVAGSPDHHLAIVQQSLDEIMRWQSENGTRIPRSDAFERGPADPVITTTPESRGRLAYDAYGRRVDFLTHDGRPMPSFDDLTKPQREAWIAAADWIWFDI